MRNLTLRGSRDSFTKFALLFLALAFGVVLSPVRHGTRIFLELGNLTDVLRQVAETGILGVGMTVVILTGGIDLSVGAVLALSATFVANALMVWHWPLGPTLLATLALGTATGAMFAGLIHYFRIPAFVATLAGMGALRGVARLMAGGSSIAVVAASPDSPGAPESFFRMAEKLGGVLSVPAAIYIAAALGVATWLRAFVTGRHVYAVGGSERAARYAGISVGRTLLLAYGVCSTLAALAGMLHAAQLEQGNPNDGFGYELDAIAAVVIGGTRLTGGYGTIFGTVVGTLVIGVLNNILGLNNIDINMQLIIKGVLILLAMGIQRRIQK